MILRSHHYAEIIDTLFYKLLSTKNFKFMKVHLIILVHLLRS